MWNATTRSRVFIRSPWIVPVLAALLAVMPSPDAIAQDFGASVPLSSSAATDPWFQSDDDISIATDGAGTWLAVWTTVTRVGEPDVREVFLSRSTDGGVTWAEQQLLNTPAGSVSISHPKLATDTVGTWVVVGHAHVGEDSDVVFSRSTDDGVSWAAPRPINEDATTESSRWDSDVFPQIVFDGSGRLIVVWESRSRNQGADISYASSSDAGQTWTEATLDSDPDYDSKRPRLATDSAGTLVAVWTRGRADEQLQGEVMFSRSIDQGTTWTSPEALNTGGAAERYSNSPVVETDDVGNWIVFWSAFRLDRGESRNDSDILYSRSSNGAASWSSPRVLSGELAAPNWGPEATTDGEVWILVWGSQNDLRGTIGDDGDLLIARSTDAGETWTAPEALDPNASRDSRQDLDPVVVTDGAGRWVAAWSSSDDAGGTIGTDFDIVFSRAHVLCPTVPASHCREGFTRGSFVAKETRPGRERVVSRMRKGPALTKADLGDPVPPLGTAYGVCIYDENHSLVASLEVDRAGADCDVGRPCWRPVTESATSSDGYLYEDKQAGAKGVTKLLVKGRKPGRSQVLVQAKNNARRGRMALPTGISNALSGHTRALVQVVTSNAACLSMELDGIVRNEPGYFKATR